MVVKTPVNDEEIKGTGILGKLKVGVTMSEFQVKGAITFGSPDQESISGNEAEQGVVRSNVHELG